MFETHQIFDKLALMLQRLLHLQHYHKSASGNTKYCTGSHTDKFNPYIYKDNYEKGSSARGITVDNGKQMVGNLNGPAGILHHPVGHTYDLGAHDFPSTYL